LAEKACLLKIAAEFEIAGAACLNKAEVVGLLSRKHSLKIEKILHQLGLAYLKTICASRGIDGRGNRKSDLVAAILGRSKPVETGRCRACEQRKIHRGNLCFMQQVFCRHVQ